MTRVIGYLRVSTDRQDVDNQRHEIHGYAEREGLTVNVWLEAEVSSRKSTKERRVDELVAMLRRGDSVIVSELSRLGRSISENLNILHDLGKKGVTTHIVKQGLRTNGKNDVMATMMLTNLSFAAELERELVSQRTKGALARLKSQGVQLGNPRLSELHAQQTATLDAHAECFRSTLAELQGQGLSQRAIVAELNHRGLLTVRGKHWTLCQLQRVMKRLEG